jgi:hypothetical protein
VQPAGAGHRKTLSPAEARIRSPISHDWMMKDHRTALRPSRAATRTRPTTSSRSGADVSLGVAMTIFSIVSSWLEPAIEAQLGGRLAILSQLCFASKRFCYCLLPVINLMGVVAAASQSTIREGHCGVPGGPNSTSWLGPIPLRKLCRNFRLCFAAICWPRKWQSTQLN